MFAGLAVMGANLARNLARNGYTVALHNRSAEKTDALLPNAEVTSSTESLGNRRPPDPPHPSRW